MRAACTRGVATDGEAYHRSQRASPSRTPRWDEASAEQEREHRAVGERLGQIRLHQPEEVHHRKITIDHASTQRRR